MIIWSLARISFQFNKMLEISSAQRHAMAWWRHFWKCFKQTQRNHSSVGFHSFRRIGRTRRWNRGGGSVHSQTSSRERLSGWHMRILVLNWKCMRRYCRSGLRLMLCIFNYFARCPYENGNLWMRRRTDREIATPPGSLCSFIYLIYLE